MAKLLHARSDSNAHIALGLAAGKPAGQLVDNQSPGALWEVSDTSTIMQLYGPACPSSYARIQKHPNASNSCEGSTFPGNPSRPAVACVKWQCFVHNDQ